MIDTSEQKKPLVLVTGSSGLIGRRVCRDLAPDHRVVGLDCVEPTGEGPDLWVECDLTDESSVRAALERVRGECGPSIASVVHLAAYYDFSGEESPLYDELTVEGTRRLLRGLAEFEVAQFVFSSSLLVMKAAEEDTALFESSPVEAEWEYPRSKLDAEQVIRQERGEIPAVILRIAGVYDEDCHSIPIAQQMRRVFEERLESYFFPGNPDHGQAFVHLEDLVACFRAAIEHREDLGPSEVFLVGESEVVSYVDMQQILGEAIHEMDWPTIRIPAPIAKVGAWVKEKLPGEDPFIKPWMIDLADAHFPISIQKARERLGWSPRYRLRETLPLMCKRLVQDPEAWYEMNGVDPPEDLEEVQARRLERARQRELARG